MQLKKTWFSYLLWVLFLSTNILLFFISWRSFFTGKVMISQQMGYVYAAVIFIAVVLLYFLLHNRIFAVLQRIHISRNLSRILFHILVLLVFTAFLIIRMQQLGSFTGHFKNTSFYDLAQVKNDGTVSFLSGFSIPDLYVGILSFLFRFLGNKEGVVLALQLLLQTAVFVVGYFTGKNFSGRLGGILVITGYSILPVFYKNSIVADPFSFELFLFVFALFLFSVYAKDVSENKKQLVKTIAYAVLCGVLYGYAKEFLFLFLLECVFLIEGQWKEIRQRILHGILYVLCTLLSVLLFMAIEVLFTNMEWTAVLKSMFLLRFSVAFQLDTLQSFAKEPFIYVLAATAVFYCLGFLTKKDERGHCLLVPFLLLAVFELCFEKSWYFGSLMAETFFLLLICAQGISDLIYSKKELTEDDMADLLGSEELTQMSWEDMLAGKNEKVEEPQEEQEQQEQKKVELIENPLPLPKKHEHKEMDYAFEPDTEEMHYDVELTDENDDYDIE